VLCYGVLKYVVVRCRCGGNSMSSADLCVVMCCCSELWCVAVLCCVAVWRSVLQCVVMK